MTLYSMGKPVGVKQSLVKQAVATPPEKAVRQCDLSTEERRLAMIYGRLPFSFSKNWDARLEPPA